MKFFGSTSVARVLLLVLALSTLAAWLWQLPRPNSSLRMEVQQVIPLDGFIESNSFSEIENAKALLDALAAHSLWEFRSRSVGYARARGPGGTAAALDVLQQLQSKVAEFKGTEQEVLFVNEQLILLSQAKMHDRWLNLYLGLLYERPTHDLVGREARHALVMAKQAGREEELIAGFQHVSRIPLDFSSKLLVQSAIPHRTMARHGAGSAKHEVL